MTEAPYSTGAVLMKPEELPNHPLLSVTEVDLGPVDYTAHATPIRNQGGRGTCVAFATAKVLEVWDGILSDRTSPWLSTEDLYNLALTYDGLADWRKANGNPDGTYVWAAAKALVEHGGVPERWLPYNQAAIGDPHNVWGRPCDEFRVDSYQVGWGLSGLRQGLSIGPCVLAVNVDRNLFWPPEDFIVRPAADNYIYGAHALPILGYDPERDAYLAANSWGTSYADGGYVWLHSSYVLERAADATSIVPNVTLKTRGDLDIDAEITPKDVLISLSALVGHLKLTDTSRQLADVNEDGLVNVADTVALLRKMIGQ